MTPEGNQTIIDLGQDLDVVAKSTFDYVYGTEDILYEWGLIQRSIAIYTQAGFKVYTTELVGAGHCNEWTDEGFPDMSTQIAAHWENRVAALGITIK